MEHVEKTEKHGKWDTHTIGTGLLRKNWQSRWETHMLGAGICWETLKNVKNEKHTL